MHSVSWCFGNIFLCEVVSRCEDGGAFQVDGALVTRSGIFGESSCIWV